MIALRLRSTYNVVYSGSIAAGLQSSVFGAAVPAGSWFAFCQSAAMGGAALAAVEGTAAAGGVAVGAISALSGKKASTSWVAGADFVPSAELITFILTNA